MLTFDGSVYTSIADGHSEISALPHGLHGLSLHLPINCHWLASTHHTSTHNIGKISFKPGPMSSLRDILA
jgi:hypothetical protein